MEKHNNFYSGMNSMPYDGQKHAYWIHERVKSEQHVKGYYLSREATCSLCGKTSNFERERCPYCGAVMDALDEQ